MRITFPRAMLTAAALATVVTAAACTSSQADNAEPVADIPSLSGRLTQVSLDPGFTGALSTLRLTPA